MINCCNNVTLNMGRRNQREQFPGLFRPISWASLVAQTVKILPTMWDPGSIPGFPFPWRSKWQPTPVFLPGRSHGWRSPIGSSPWGHKELDTTEWHFLPLFRSVRYLGSPETTANRAWSSNSTLINSSPDLGVSIPSTWDKLVMKCLPNLGLKLRPKGKEL